ncbi:anti-sigma factor [Yoonia sp.]|uniref:anti-sigma factor family protein n=1 Tax=Yoonia sp. TaxID=2212373 RepID=UPI0019F2F83B|nr:zf-HC2 domain-containing protein [Yoonia sp.]MBE0414779.1 zf-HC2 domain-containing protein [Yoonia sp.]
MLSCKDIADRASALNDGELSGWDALQIRLHLAMCKGCSRFVAQMRATDQLAARASDPGEPLEHEADDRRLTEILSTLRKEQSRH